MYKLISKYGNEIAYTDKNEKKDELIGYGFKIVDDDAKKSKRVVKSNASGKKRTNSK